MKPTVQKLVVQADNADLAFAKITDLILSSDAKHISIISNEATQLTTELLKSIKRAAYVNFLDIAAGLDINRIVAGISAHCDDRSSPTGEFVGGVRERFKSQSEIAIDIIKHLDGQWTKDSVVVDLQSESSDIAELEEKMKDSSKKFFYVEAKVML